jgi:GntR family transcriptional regulator
VTARYQEIADDLRGRIAAGEWPPDTTLPRQADLAAHYDVDKRVISDAIAVLETEGLVRAVRRRGTVVLPPVTRRRIRRGTQVTRNVHHAVGATVSGYNFPAAHGEAWQAHGQPRRSMEPATARVAELLGLTAGDEVLRRRRVTSPVGEPPFQVADTWVHPAAVADAPAVAEASTGPGGYLDRLEEAGHGPISWEEFVRARMPSPDEASLLNIAVRMPVLEIARVGTSSRTAQPIEVTVCVIPADRVELASRLQRAPSAAWPRAED